MADAPYPELKKTHTMAHKGRPWTDYKPPPAAAVWSVIEGFGSYHLLLAALELDVFGTVDRTGPTAIGPLAGEVGASEPHLQALLDSLVTLGLLEQYCSVYGLNNTAERYLTSRGEASMVDLIPVAPGPHGNWANLAETIRSGRPATPIDDDPAAFYVPLVEGTFTTMLRAATRADLMLRYSSQVAPRVLDLGAGGAPWTIAVLKACPDGSAVVNDLPGVLGVAERMTAEHGVWDRCRFLQGDFHEVALEDGTFDLVVLGHVCRTEGEAGARHLVERAYSALRPGGRVMLADYFVDPERRFNRHGVLMGMTMMTSTLNGSPLSNEQVVGWLRDAGFRALRLIEPIGFQFVYVATMPR